MSNHDIFNKFSQNARRVLISAQKIAQSMDTALGSEHILLSLAITPKTLAQSILREQMVGLDQIRLIVSLHHFTNEPCPGMTREAKEALKIAAQTALEFRHSQIDSEHLLWGIVAQNNFHAAEIVDRIGITPEAIIDQIRGFFEEMEDIEEPMKPSSHEPQFDFQTPPESMPEMPIFPPLPTKVTMENFITDLTQLARDNKIDPVIGRDQEIQRVIQILGRRTKNNPCLVGEPGVGKTAIVEGLARRIVEGNIPPSFLNKRVVMLDLALLVAGTMYRGQFEERIKKVMDELIAHANTILFIDELHTIVGAGAAEGGLDVANIIKPALAKGKLHLVGATSFDEYRKFIEKDPALERRLQKVTVNEPTPEETIKILDGIKPNFEAHHGVKISDEAVKAAVELSVRYINDRYLPDKAIDLIDEAASAWQLKHQDGSQTNRAKLQHQIQQIRSQKEKEVELENFPKAAELRSLELRLAEQLKSFNPPEKKIEGEIGREEIAKVLSSWTNIPVGTLEAQEKMKFSRLAQNLKKKIIGQNEAVEEVAAAIRRTKSGLSDPNRPIGSFIFLGPTGVGKTELARVLAEALFGDREALIKIDMSEFMEHFNISRLIGAPPGYVGYEEAGRLTEAVRQRPYSIVLFDEIEKADAQVFNLLLQILEDGELSDAQGRKISFRNTVVIMTSNIGVAQLNRQAVIGFTTTLKNKTQEYEKIKEEIIKQLKDQFRPELLNRIDKIIVFHPLGQKEINKIAVLQLDELAGRIVSQGYKIKIAASVSQLIAQKGFEPQFGARPLRRAIADLIENPLSSAILAGHFKPGDIIKIDIKGQKVIFHKTLKSTKASKALS